MTRRVIIENPYITVTVDPELRLIRHRMHQPCVREVFRSALLAGVDAMRVHGATKWLSDDRANGALPPEDEAWAKNVWFPATLKAGWSHWALVKPISVVGQLNMRQFTETYSEFGIAVNVFTDPEPAEAWITAAG